MADRNQLKRAVPPQPEKDPFAELTRIMGFDPRVPVSRPQPVAIDLQQDDLSLDLEKELMGEFNDIEDVVNAEPEVIRAPARQDNSAPPKAADTEGEAALSDVYDFVFDAERADHAHDPVAYAAAQEALDKALNDAFGSESPAPLGVRELVNGTAERAAMPAATMEPLETELPTFAAPLHAELPAARSRTEFPAAMPKEDLAPVVAIEASEASPPTAEAPEAAPPNDYQAMIVDDQIAFMSAEEGPSDHDASPADKTTATDDASLHATAVGLAPGAPELGELVVSAGLADPAMAEAKDPAEDVPLIPLGAVRDLVVADPAVPLGHDAIDGPAETAAAEEDREPYDLEAELTALLGTNRSLREAEPAPMDEPADDSYGAGGDAYFDQDEARPAAFAASPVAGDDPLRLTAEAASESGASAEAGPTVALQTAMPEASGVSSEPPDEAIADAGTPASAVPAVGQIEAAALEEDVDPIADFLIEQQVRAELAGLEPSAFGGAPIWPAPIAADVSTEAFAAETAPAALPVESVTPLVENDSEPEYRDAVMSEAPGVEPDHLFPAELRADPFDIAPDPVENSAPPPDVVLDATDLHVEPASAGIDAEPETFDGAPIGFAEPQAAQPWEPASAEAWEPAVARAWPPRPEGWPEPIFDTVAEPFPQIQPALADDSATDPVDETAWQAADQAADGAFQAIEQVFDALEVDQHALTEQEFAKPQAAELETEDLHLAEPQPAEQQAKEAEASEPQAEEQDPFEALAAMVRDVRPAGPPFAFTPSATSAASGLGSWAANFGLRAEPAPEAAPQGPEPTASVMPSATPNPTMSGSVAPSASENANVSTANQYHSLNRSYGARGAVSVPDIDTVDVPEGAVALADDLDIPEVGFEEDIPLAADFDDFEAELANAFRHQSATAATGVEQRATSPLPRDPYRNDDPVYRQPEPAYGDRVGPVATVAAAAAGTTAYSHLDPAAAGPAAFEATPADRLAGNTAPEAVQDGDDDDLAYDPMLNEEMATSNYAEQPERRKKGGRGLLITAILGGLVVVGGLAAFAVTGRGDHGAPAVVRADGEPVKVRPENPGGTTVPNQDNKVFQTMNGEDDGAAPAQNRLISGTEDPIDVGAKAAAADAAQPTAEDAVPTSEDEGSDDGVVAGDDPVADEIDAAPKGEDRVAATDQAAGQPASGDGIAVAPRRVRTMIVRPDGSLVPSETPAAAAADPQAAAPATPQATGADAASLEPADSSTDVPAPADDDETAALPSTPPAVAKPAAKAAAPVAAAKEAAPAKPTQIADAGGAAAAAGSWSMQIASQPSEAAAQSTYNDLAKRYNGVIGNKGVNIVKAEVAGKGTFWRVRVPAGSRDDAISLCESYKTAGGNCFVSR